MDKFWSEFKANKALQEDAEREAQKKERCDPA